MLRSLIEIAVTRLRIGSETGPQVLSGTGSPAGAVSAVPGSVYLRDTNGALWVKGGAASDATGWAETLKADAVTSFNPTGAWQAYVIPTGAKRLQITAIGPGGIGGSGFSRAAGSAGGGGGGGASGAISTVEVLVAKLAVSTIYVNPGLGGGGNVTWVSIAQDTFTQNAILRAAAGSNGGNGSAAAAGAAGVAALITTAIQQVLAQLGLSWQVAGQAGSNGGAQTGAAGSAITWGATGSLVSGGAGGAGCTTTDSAGGVLTAGSSAIVTPISAGAAAGGAGQPGAAYPTRGIYTGGTGGGSNNSGTGGKGGDGAIGSGGGGGGAGVTGGAGGAGGPGFAMITAVF
jgi:hypothetical protein